MLKKSFVKDGNEKGEKGINNKDLIIIKILDISFILRNSLIYYINNRGI